MLWAPFRRRLVLAGVRLESTGHSASIERDPVCVFDALRSHWNPHFTDQPVDMDAIDRYLDMYLPSFEAPLLHVPSVNALRAALRRATPSAPGPDRLMAKAWMADERLSD
eukprot:3463444-Pyramimonas_sp.AAC.1